MNKITCTQFIVSYIQANKKLSKLYSPIKKHPNSKYKINSIINDILYILKTGISWRSIRSTNNWQSIYFHFNRFSKFKIFSSLFKNIRNKYIRKNKINNIVIDSSFIPNKNGKTLLARNKFFKNKNCNKLNIITDSYGTPLTAFLSKGNFNDCRLFNPTYNSLNKSIKKSSKFLLADKGYISKYIRNTLSNDNISLMTPTKKGATKTFYFCKKLYKKRITVEQTFQKIKAFRRIQIRYDSNHHIFSEFIFLSLFCIIYRTL